MNQEFAKALATPLKVAAFILIGVAIYYLMPEPLQKWLMTKADWVWNKIPGIK